MSRRQGGKGGVRRRYQSRWCLGMAVLSKLHSRDMPWYMITFTYIESRLFDFDVPQSPVPFREVLLYPTVQ